MSAPAAENLERAGPRFGERLFFPDRASCHNKCRENRLGARKIATQSRYSDREADGKYRGERRHNFESLNLWQIPGANLQTRFRLRKKSVHQKERDA